MVLIFVAAVGLAGSVLFGVQGWSAGSGGELERIFALGCLFMTAAAILGILLDDGRRERKNGITREERVHLLVAAPLVLLMLGVLLLTLVPAIYVMLPFFGAKRVLVRRRPPLELPPSAAPIGTPAYA